MAIHLDTNYGFRETACGKSLHGWANASRKHPIQSTTDRRAVTCKLCLKKLAK
jgi:hypothetical protein